MINNQVLTKNVSYYSVEKDHFLQWCEFVLEKELGIKDTLKFEDIDESWMAVASKYGHRLGFSRGGEIGFFASKMFKKEEDILHGQTVYEVGDCPMEVHDVDYIISILKDGFEFSSEYESFLVFQKISC
jgi:hypothetical protein